MEVIKGSLTETQAINSNIVDHSEDVIEGFLLETDNIKGSISGMSEICGALTPSNDYPVYDGINEVTPLAYQSTTLPTNGRLMESDIVVKEVPYYETSNASGHTVYIARTT